MANSAPLSPEVIERLKSLRAKVSELNRRDGPQQMSIEWRSAVAELESAALEALPALLAEIERRERQAEAYDDAYKLAYSQNEAMSTRIATLASEIERLREEVTEKANWIGNAVASCAKRQCSMRDQQIRDLEAEVSTLTSDLATARAELAEERKK